MIRPEPRPVGSLRLAGDAAVAVGAFYLAFLARIELALPLTEMRLPADRLDYFVGTWALVAVAQGISLYVFGLYDPPHSRRLTELGRRLATPVVVQALGLAALFFLADRSFPRSVLLVYAFLDLALVVGWRWLLARVVRLPARRVVVVGCGPEAVELAVKIRLLEPDRVELVGWVAPPADATTDEAAETKLPDVFVPLDGVPLDRSALGRHLGTVDDLPALAADGRFDDLILASPSPPWRTRLLDRMATEGGSKRGSILVLPGPFESLIGRMRYRWVRDIPLIEVVRESEWRVVWPVKRSLDLVAGTLLLLLAAPLMVACAMAVRLSSPGPILYRQERVGRGLKPFTVWKFRTMGIDAEGDGGEVLARPGDPRLTPIGATLRALRLDELPQLFNVLQGTMSLVGPRPERPGFVARYLEEVPGYAERFSIAPGLTGLAQINGEYHSTAANKLRYDLAYMANWSPWLDLVILLRTVKIVLTSRGV